MNTILTPEKYQELKGRFPRFNEPWSQEETEYLREMAEMDYTFSLMAAELGRSPNSIKMKLKSMGLYTPKPASRPWTGEDDRRLIDLYLQNRSFQELAGTFGRSEKAIIERLIRLRAGLRPEAETNPGTGPRPETGKGPETETGPEAETGNSTHYGPATDRHSDDSDIPL